MSAMRARRGRAPDAGAGARAGRCSPARRGRVRGDLPRRPATIRSTRSPARSSSSPCREPFFVGDHALHIGATIGIADRAAATASMPRRCCAMPISRSIAPRQSKRGTFCRFEPAMDVAAQRKARLENDLRIAVRHGELVRPLPAADRSQHRRDRRLRGAAALGSSRARLLYPDSLHPARRGNRA